MTIIHIYGTLPTASRAKRFIPVNLYNNQEGITTYPLLQIRKRKLIEVTEAWLMDRPGSKPGSWAPGPGSLAVDHYLYTVLRLNIG